MIKKYILIALPLLMLMGSCNNFNKLLKEGDPETKLAMAMEYYENEDYFRALQLFDNVMPYFRGRPEMEKIYYYYAWSFFNMEQYLMAAYHFRNLAKTFPNSKYTEECYFQAAYCKYAVSPEPSLDQSNTQEAINELQLFINKYPNSDLVGKCNALIDELRMKMEVKAFEIAKLYFFIEEYQAAIVAMNNVLEDYPGTKYKEEAMYIIAKSNYFYASGSVYEKQKERYQSTLEACKNFSRVFPESKYAKEVMSFEKKAQAELENIN
ncbi:MAG: outer membrane protein assembly factor BamD [Marinilabiliales bacterium]|nr:MAG: outer membrane protein assembly factor BamD [Marinilabiliales bacterium]